jgi:hypothetical protein
MDLHSDLAIATKHDQSGPTGSERIKSQVCVQFLCDGIFKDISFRKTSYHFCATAGAACRGGYWNCGTDAEIKLPSRSNAASS